MGNGIERCPGFHTRWQNCFFQHWHDGNGTIMVSRLQGGKWSKPEPAAFSGQWRDIEPAMAPDGSYLVFSSNRPATEGGKAIDGFFQGKAQPGKGGNLWRVNKTRDGWSEPVRLPDELNSNTAIYSPSVARSEISISISRILLAKGSAYAGRNGSMTTIPRRNRFRSTTT